MRNIKECKNCKKIKIHYGYGLCTNCYQNTYRKNHPIYRQKQIKRCREYNKIYYAKNKNKIIKKTSERQKNNTKKKNYVY